VPVGFVPAHFPEQPLANAPAAPATDPCGTLTPQEQAAITPPAQQAFDRLTNGRTEVVFRRR